MATEDHGPYALHHDDRDDNAEGIGRIGASTSRRGPATLPPCLQVGRQREVLSYV